MKEVWKDIKGFEGLYQVSNLGRVKKIRNMNETIMNLNPNKSGYVYKTFVKDNVVKTFSIHRLVAILFIPNNFNKKEVNHINGIKTDNRADNLEWVTPKENSKHSWINGLSKSKKGENHGRAKLTENDVYEIKYINKELNISQLSKKYNVSRKAIRLIKNNINWSHV